MGACPMVTMGSYEKSLKVTMGGRRPDAYGLCAEVPDFYMGDDTAPLFRHSTPN